jgi:hypothetical protein
MPKEKLVGSFGGCPRRNWSGALEDAPGELAGRLGMLREIGRDFPYIPGTVPADTEGIRSPNREPSDYPNLAVLVEIKRENQPLSG